MACYAAVLSLFHTLDNIKKHPRPPISLDQEQLRSLTQNLTFLQDFLERYSGEEDDDLVSRIAAAAYAAEDVIETHIVDQIHAGSNITTVDLSRGLDLVIQDMDLIRNEVMQIKKHKDIAAQLHDHLPTNSASSTWQSSIKPVLDDAIVTQVLDKLTGQQSALQIIPIVGMGGIGKTTFATSIYTNPLIVEHFDIRAWVTVSQQYSRRNILQVLCQEVEGSIYGLLEMSEDEIGLILYKHLCGRRYLIVMDDIWSIDAWYKVKSFFPDNNDGSRIMITTRLSNLAFKLSSCHAFQMKFLDEDKSWDLLCGIVFGELGCPIELENIGKEIARKCRGLPLSIAVIGGLLKKSNMSQAYWIQTFENLNLLINLGDDEYTLRVMRTSYKELPMNLKPCFLYMGIFPEDHEIKISVLIKLWVAEGILKPIDDKSLEEVAIVYLKELIDRNLIIISSWRVLWDEKPTSCKIHDVLRDVCLREAQKQRFFCIVSWQQKHHTPQGIDMERCICINPENTGENCSPQFLQAVEPALLARCLLYENCEYWAPPSLRFRLLRIYSAINKHTSICSDNTIFEHANLRYLSLKLNFRDAAPRLSSLCSLLWNMQTLKIEFENSYSPEPRIAPSEIWEMPLLRHVMLKELALPDPPNGEDNFVLENLQTLNRVKNLKFSEEVVRRIPNIKKMRLTYDIAGVEELSDFYFNNLGHLQKLEFLDLNIFFSSYCVAENVGSNWMSFPHSLKTLSLFGTKLSWEELTIKIGSLPFLQVLSLRTGACTGTKWETVEGQFYSLRLLELEYPGDLKCLDTDSTHFPRLEHLVLVYTTELQEIPSSIGDIPTLKSIQLVGCNRSVADSAKRIKEEQEENGNEDLKVDIFRIGRVDSANLEADEQH